MQIPENQPRPAKIGGWPGLANQTDAARIAANELPPVETLDPRIDNFNNRRPYAWNHPHCFFWHHPGGE